MLLLKILRALRKSESVKKKKRIIYKHIMASMEELEERIRKDAREDLDEKIDKPYRFL